MSFALFDIYELNSRRGQRLRGQWHFPSWYVVSSWKRLRGQWHFPSWYVVSSWKMLTSPYSSVSIYRIKCYSLLEKSHYLLCREKYWSWFSFHFPLIMRIKSDLSKKIRRIKSSSLLTFTNIYVKNKTGRSFRLFYTPYRWYNNHIFLSMAALFIFGNNFWRQTWLALNFVCLFIYLFIFSLINKTLLQLTANWVLFSFSFQV